MLFRSNPENRRIRMWSAGCAKGEEPYSLAILTEEINSKNPVEIYATDIDTESIAQAYKGKYDASRVKNVPHELLRKYFEADNKNNYFLKGIIREWVTFKRNDLINDVFFSGIDIIICRNVFIYFTKPLQEHILNKFYNSLRDGGYLIIGKAETIVSEAKIVFDDVDENNRVYRKKSIK